MAGGHGVLRAPASPSFGHAPVLLLLHRTPSVPSNRPAWGLGPPGLRGSLVLPAQGPTSLRKHFCIWDFWNCPATSPAHRLLTPRTQLQCPARGPCTGQWQAFNTTTRSGHRVLLLRRRRMEACVGISGGLWERALTDIRTDNAHTPRWAGVGPASAPEAQPQLPTWAAALKGSVSAASLKIMQFTARTRCSRPGTPTSILGREPCYRRTE